MEFRFKAYDRLGAYRGILPNPLEAIVGKAFNDLTTLNLHYDRNSVNSSLLDNEPEIAVETYKNGAWEEIKGGRLRALTVDFDHLEEVPTRRYDFLGIGESLKGALVYAPAGLPVNDEGKVNFGSTNAGRVLDTIWNNAVTRGWNGLFNSFSSTNDSAGNPWNKTFSISFDVSTSLLSIVNQFVAQGLIDVVWEGRTMHAYNKNYITTNLSTGANPIRFAGTGHTLGTDAAPEMIDQSSLATHVIVLGEKGLRWEFPTGASVPEGRREVIVSYSGVDDIATAQLLADPLILKSQNHLKNTTRQFHLTADTTTLPFHHYDVGNWIDTQRGTVFESMQIIAVNVQINQNGIQGYVTLGDKIDDLLETMYHRIQGLTGGIANEGGTPPAISNRMPAAPTGVVVTTDALLDAMGKTYSAVGLSWVHNGKDISNEAIDIKNYSAYYREAGTFTWRPMFTTTALQGSFSPLETYDELGDLNVYEFMVQARSNKDMESLPSITVTKTMTDDTTAPPTPTTPQANVWLRSVSIVWDGNGLSASQVPIVMPADFKDAVIWESTAANMSGKVEVGRLRGAGTFVLGSRPAGVTRWYAITAYDRSGNASAMSAASSMTPVDLVDESTISQALNAMSGDIGANVEAITEAAAVAEQAVIDALAALQASNVGGKTYIQNTPPAANPLYAWAGTPRLSESLFYGNGSDQPATRRNLANSPHGVQGWISTSGYVGSFAPDAGKRPGMGARKWTFTSSANRYAPYGRAAGSINTAGSGAGLATGTPRVTPGLSYGAGLWMRSDRAFPRASVTLRWQDDAGVSVGSSPGVTVALPKDTWVWVSSVGTAPAGATNLSVENVLDNITNFDTRPFTTWGADVLIEQRSTAPLPTDYFDGWSGDDRFTALWIDTTGGTNTPKRFNGTTWEVVTDKAASDALTAAQDAADDAEAARLLAVAAQSTADGKNTVSAAAPTVGDLTGKKANSLWTQVVGGKVVGAWYKATDTATVWTAMPFDPVMIPQIAIGTGTFGDLDGIRLAVNSVKAKHLWIGSYANLVPNGSGDGGVGFDELTFDGTVRPGGTSVNGSFKAIPTQRAAQDHGERWVIDRTRDHIVSGWVYADVANSRYYVQVFFYDRTMTYIATTFYAANNAIMPTTWGQFSAKFAPAAKAGYMVFPSNAVYASLRIFPNHTNGTAVANQYFAGLTMRELETGELIVDGAVKAVHMSANSVKADAIEAGAVEADKLEATLALVTSIVAGPPTGTHARMDPSGFRIFAADPVDGIPNEVARMGVAATNDYFAVLNAAGDPIATISEDATISGEKVYANSELYYKGRSLQDYLDMAPRGIQAYGLINQTIGFGTNEFGMFDVSFIADARRAYRVHVKTTTSTSTADGVKWRIRSAVGGRPTITSFLQRDHESIGSTTQWLSDSWSFVSYPSYQTTGSWQERYLLTGQKMGSGSASFQNGEVVIEDIGPRIWAVAGINAGGGTVAPSAQYYEKFYNPTSIRSYTGANATYNFDTGRIYQGLSPAGYGDLKSIVCFPSLTGDLSGATIHSIELYIYYAHWYNNSGGTAAIGVHNHSTVPATFSWVGNVATRPGIPKPGGAWIAIPSNHFANFQSGAYKGITINGNNTYATYGIANPPQLKITYSK